MAVWPGAPGSSVAPQAAAPSATAMSRITGRRSFMTASERDLPGGTRVIWRGSRPRDDARELLRNVALLLGDRKPRPKSWEDQDARDELLAGAPEPQFDAAV